MFSREIRDGLELTANKLFLFFNLSLLLLIGCVQRWMLILFLGSNGPDRHDIRLKVINKNKRIVLIVTFTFAVNFIEKAHNVSFFNIPSNWQKRKVSAACFLPFKLCGDVWSCFCSGHTAESQVTRTTTTAMMMMVAMLWQTSPQSVGLPFHTEEPACCCATARLPARAPGSRILVYLTPIAERKVFFFPSSSSSSLLFSDIARVNK